MAGTRRARMRDVAQAAGVSTMTVSRALREGGFVAAETRARVVEAARRLDYSPDALAAALSSQRSGFVAALVPSLNNPHFADTVGALSETLEASGLQVLIGHTDYEPAREARLLAELMRRRPEAVVATADGHSAATRALLRRAAVPVVEIWDRPARPIGHVVGFSNREAGGAMLRHLAACGYRRIAFLGEEADADTRGARRREGYLAELESLGLGPPRVLAHARPPITMLQGREGLRALLARWPEVDAVMCVSDPCAFGVLTEAGILGRRVPDDLGVAGFGDFEVSRCCVPAITTIGVDAAQIGREAGRLVLARLGGASAGDVEVELRVEARGSTRPPR